MSEETLNNIAQESGRFDVRNYMESTHKKHEDFMHVIYEAIKNSLESLKVRKFPKNESPEINLSINLQNNTANEQELVSIEIQDNGYGFDTESYNRFVVFFTPNKGFNNNGSGRFQFLHRFNKIRVESIFQEENKTYKREFYFDNRGIPIDHTIIEVGYNTKLFTKLILTSPNFNDKDKTLIDTIKISDFVSLIKTHFLVRFFLLKQESPDNFPIISSIFSNKRAETNNSEQITSDNILIPVDTGSLKIPYMKVVRSDNNKPKFEETLDFEALNFAKFKASSNLIIANSAYLCANGVNVEKLNISKYMNTSDEFNGQRYQTCFYGDILNANISSIGNKLEFPSIKDIRDEFSNGSLFKDDKFLFIETIQGKAVAKFADIHKEETEAYKDKTEEAERIANETGISQEIAKKIKISAKDTEETIVKKLYRELADKFTKNTIEVKKKIANIHHIDPSSDTYEETLTKEVEGVSSLLDEQDKEDLSRYVVRRRLVLELLNKLLNKQLACQDPKSHREDLFHNLFFKKYTSSEDGLNDLWVLNEEFMYFKGHSEYEIKDFKDDKGNAILKNIPKEDWEEFKLENELKQRPDVYLFIEEGKCVLIDFKDPKVRLRDHLNQLEKYSRLIANYSNIDTFYCYLVGENVIEPMDLNDYKPTQWGGYVRNYSLNSYRTTESVGKISIEVIKYSDILARANRRNAIYFDTLRLNKSNVNENFDETDSSCEEVQKEIDKITKKK